MRLREAKTRIQHPTCSWCCVFTLEHELLLWRFKTAIYDWKR